MKRLLQKLEHTTSTWFLITTLFVFFLLRLPSLVEPYWYGDEGIYETIAQALIHGRALYSGIWDNKPPLLYWTYALFAGDQFSIKALSLLFGMGEVTMFFFLARKLFPLQKRLIYILTALFAFLLATPIAEGNIANAENFMLLPIISSALLIYANGEKPRIKNLFWGGLLLGLAFLYKTVAIFDAISFCLFLIFTHSGSNTTFRQLFSRGMLRRSTKLIQLYALGFILPFLITLIYFTFQGTLWTFLTSTFMSNIDYVGLDNGFLIPQGFLLFKLVLLLGVLIWLFVNRQSYTSVTLFILLWLSLSMFNSFFSQRDYTHYILVLIPSAVLAISLFWQPIRTFKLPILLFVVCIIGISWYYFIGQSYKRIIPYYQNYVAYYSGKITSDQYRAFFDKRTPEMYTVADYLRAHKASPTTFIWGDAGQMYVLSHTLPVGRYTVAYHIVGNKNAEEETQTAIYRQKPTYVVIMSDAPALPFPIIGYQPLISISNTMIYERSY